MALERSYKLCRSTANYRTAAKNILNIYQRLVEYILQNGSGVKFFIVKKKTTEVFNSAYSFVEICDWIPAVLVGETRPENLKRSICAAGHKAMYNEQWDGLPDSNFLEKLSPGLSDLRNRINYRTYSLKKE